MFWGLRGFESDLFDEFRRLEHEVDQLFGASLLPGSIRDAARGTFPPMNIGCDADQVVVYLFAPGVVPKSLDITMRRNLLTVSGKRTVIAEEGAEYYRRERFDGEFRRVVTLPEDVDPDRVDARYTDGVLVVTVKRSGETKPKQITVH